MSNYENGYFVSGEVVVTLIYKVCISRDFSGTNKKGSRFCLGCKDANLPEPRWKSQSGG